MSKPTNTQRERTGFDSIGSMNTEVMKTENKNKLWCVVTPVLTFVLGTMALASPDPADDGRDDDAGRIRTLSQITSQVGKYPHPESEFFKSASLLAELQKILGPDYNAYREHLSHSGSGMLENEGGYVCGDVSQPHVGGYSSLFFVDPKNEKMYLFWLKKSVSEKEYQIYGNGPIPGEVLSSIAKRMNQKWGHVASFKFSGERLVIEDAENK